VDQPEASDVLACLAQKSPLWVWPETALAFSKSGPSQSRYPTASTPRPQFLAHVVVLDGRARDIGSVCHRDHSTRLASSSSLLLQQPETRGGGFKFSQWNGTTCPIMVYY
jgi:hypothetical protein